MADPTLDAINMLRGQTAAQPVPAPIPTSQVITPPSGGSIDAAINMLSADISGKEKIKPPAPTVYDVPAMPKKEIASPTGLPSAFAPPDPRTFTLSTNAANSTIASVGDALLNAPTNLWNIAKSVPSIVQGNPLPEQTPTPDFARRLMTHMGFINPAVQPQTTGERMLTAGIGGLTAGMMAPASSVGNLMSNMATTAIPSMIGQGTTEATGNPALGLTASMAATPLASSAVNAAQRYGANALEAQRVLQGQNALRDQTLKEAQNAGYVIPPSAVNPSGINKRLESVAGKAAIGQEAAVKNQQVTNDIARNELGLPKDAPITEQSLSNLRNKVSAPYREVAAIDPEAAKALEDLKQARYDANVYFRHYDVSADPKSLATAKASSAKADTLEKYIDEIAANAGKPDLVERLRDARTQIAKSYDVERALNVGNGDVSARILGRAIDKGKPLTGGLATAARFAEAFPHYTRDGAVMPTPGVSKSEALASVMMGLGGMGATGNPMGLMAGALPLASGPVRSGILSSMYQNRMAQPNYNPGITPQLMSGFGQSTDPVLRMLLQGSLGQQSAPQ